MFAFSSKVAVAPNLVWAPLRCLVNRLAGQPSPANLFTKHLTGGKCVQIEQLGFQERSELQKSPKASRNLQKHPGAEASSSLQEHSEALTPTHTQGSPKLSLEEWRGGKLTLEVVPSSLFRGGKEEANSHSR